MPQIGPLGRGDPQQLGPFRLAGRVGEGGQGVVYLGQDEAGERAAVKLLHVKFTGDLTARSRFARELKAAERVASFCTARVIAADLDGDTPYIASEYIEGRSLRETIETGGPLSGNALQRLAVGTATALTAIHHAGIVHRDFKPDNVLMAADGPRVVDFGIARILDSTGTITSRAVGTPAYMAPEQISGGEVGPPADVFAWASTVSFAATGAVPFGGNSIAVVLNRVLNHEVDVSGLPEPLRGVVGSCLNKSPYARPSADQVLLRLLGHAETAGASTAVLSQGAELAGRETIGSAWAGRGGTRALHAPAPPGPTGEAGPSSGGPRKPRRGRWAAAAIAVLLVAGGGTLAVRQWGPGWMAGAHASSPPVKAGVPSNTPHVTPTTPATFSSLVDKAAGTHKLTIGMRDLVPGIALSGGDTWHGFEVEVGTYIARQLGVPVSGITFKATGMAERVSQVNSGKVDLVIATYSINGDHVTFAGPYYTAHVDVLVRSGEPYDTVGDLKGHKMCSPGASKSTGIVQDAVDVRLVSADTYADCMNLLRQGLVDAVPGDDLLLAGFANRESIRYKVLGARLTDERYAVAVKRGDVRACTAVRAAITQMYADGTAKRLLVKYFSKVGFTPETVMPAQASCG
ncbi:serine/threonine-protein kinase [Sphaerisporangium corydalis]|uniref:Serine/threonine-protein kinase n=1 Tax=Sphaerisporangium corydalis TaxID=1441875 RepID=A0ABV9EEG5_9ACTN|nr:serine/threonine-protein kinase [Sphaerisporangium corydalis]